MQFFVANFLVNPVEKFYILVDPEERNLRVVNLLIVRENSMI